MVEECEPPEPLTFEQIEEWAAEASQELKRRTGAVLPRLTSSPQRPRHSVRCPQLGIQIPRGSLFYPCCGTDTSDAIRLFGECVTTFYFADPYNPPPPVPEAKNDSHPIDIPHIVTVVPGPGERRETNDSTRTILSYRKDGLLTFIEDVRELSIFYYCGDSYGEGGSNQRWLEPVLFHAVLGKLLDGGLVVTDGSNCGYWNEDYIYAPWNALCGREPCDPPETGASFVYANRSFIYVGEAITSRGRNPSAWQVSSANEI